MKPCIAWEKGGCCKAVPCAHIHRCTACQGLLISLSLAHHKASATAPDTEDLAFAMHIQLNIKTCRQLMNDHLHAGW